MMLRGNLATRPFYNERIVAVILAVVAVAVLALTAWNVTRLLQLSARRSELRAQIAADEAAAARIRQSAVAVQQSVDRSTLATLAGSAREANSLIDERTFSWTTLFSLIEETIPAGVRLTSITPEIEKGEIVITMLLVARQVEDVTTFMTSLEGTGAFYDVLPTVADRTDDGLERVTVRAPYAPPMPVGETKSVGGGGR